VPLYNYFNRVPQPKDEGYSVRVTYARDYRGGRFTYDGHLGTDFAVPVGTDVVAGAPGVVTRVQNELDRGGLKVCVDHGRGMLSTSNHLSRSLVRVGQTLLRGEVLGLSGASGVEFLLFFPWVAPHLHYNLWLNSEPVDPFARPGEVSLWREGDDPRPALPREREAGWGGEQRPIPSPWSEEGVAQSIAACGDPELRARMEAIEWLPARGTEVVVQRNYRPPLFSSFPEVYARRFPREARFDLPFRHEDFVGVAHAPGSKAPHAQGAQKVA
jgi:murein DD-endopeptidase